MPVLAGEGGGFAEGAVEEEEEVELVEEDGHEEQSGGEVDFLGPVIILEDVESGPGAEGEEDGEHGDAGVAEESGEAGATGEVEEVEVEDDGGQQFDELLKG